MRSRRRTPEQRERERRDRVDGRECGEEQEALHFPSVLHTHGKVPVTAASAIAV